MQLSTALCGGNMSAGQLMRQVQIKWQVKFLSILNHPKISNLEMKSLGLGKHRKPDSISVQNRAGMGLAHHAHLVCHRGVEEVLPPGLVHRDSLRIQGRLGSINFYA
jgi:hypothetical protein